MERNTLMFNGDAILDEIISTLEKAFKGDEWFELFDNNEIVFTTYQDRVSDTFPVIVISIIDDYPYKRTIDSNQIANHTRFSLRITIYNKKSKNKNLDREKVSRLISNQVISTLQTTFGYVYNYNQPAPNEDVDVYRKIIGYEMTIDNKNGNIYLE